MGGLKDLDRKRRKLQKNVSGFVTGKTYAKKVEKAFEINAKRKKDEEGLLDSKAPMPSDALIDESKRNSRRRQKARRGRRSTILTSLDE